MVRYRCGNCNYVFEPKVKDKIPNRCPYCSVFGHLFEERSLLEGVDKESFDNEEG